MSCKCAKFDGEDCIWECSVSGDRCIFMIPSARKCAELFGEGPLADTVPMKGAEQCKK